jgi:hypothetical protein
VVFEDSAAALGILVAAAGTTAAMLTGDSRWDGVASLVIAGSANSIVTVQLAPNNVVATLSLDFFDYMRAPEIERAVVELENKIRSAHPEVSALFIKPQSVQVAQRRAQGETTMSPDDFAGTG